MWKYGRAESITSPGRGLTASQARTWAALASRLAWLRVANLGRPVVPPVGCRRAGSPPRAAVSTGPPGVRSSSAGSAGVSGASGSGFHRFSRRALRG